MFNSFKLSLFFLPLALGGVQSCAAHSIQWEGKIQTHTASYMREFDDFRNQICTPRAEELFEKYLRDYRGQGYWIPERNDDVDVESIKSLLPEMEKNFSG